MSAVFPSAEAFKVICVLYFYFLVFCLLRDDSFQILIIDKLCVRNMSSSFDLIRLGVNLVAIFMDNVPISWNRKISVGKNQHCSNDFDKN